MTGSKKAIELLAIDEVGTVINGDTPLNPSAQMLGVESTNGTVTSGTVTHTPMEVSKLRLALMVDGTLYSLGTSSQRKV